VQAFSFGEDWTNELSGNGQEKKLAIFLVKNLADLWPDQ
jgi:hypothetical protein